MRYASVLKPAAVLGGAAIASSAGAVTTIETDFTTSTAGTLVAIGVANADAQYEFYTDTNGKTYLEGREDAVVGALNSARIPTAAEAFLYGTSIKTDDDEPANDPERDYVGLKFDIAGVDQLGYAVLKDGGLTIDSITYDAAPVVTPETPPVPEPTTWAMMIAGLGAVGLAERRRRRAQLVKA